MWTLDTSDRIKNLTWWWWWWLFFIHDKNHRPRQFMILWSTKNADNVLVNNFEWKRRMDIEKLGNLLRFHGMVAAWFYDGEMMHEPYLLKEDYFRCKYDKNKPNIGKLEHEGDKISHYSYDGEKYTVFAHSSEYKIKFEIYPWIEKLCDGHYVKKKMLGKMGYSIFRFYYMKCRGMIEHEDKEEFEGSAYFQKVTVNAPAIPWYWGVIHFEDGSYVDYYKPHIGIPMFRTTDNQKSKLTFGELPVSMSAFFYHRPTDSIYKFKKVKITFNLRNSLPVFRVVCKGGKNSGHEMKIILKTYSRTYWRFEQKKKFPMKSILYYNEYPAIVGRFEFKSRDLKVADGDLGRAYANCEHSWGFLY